MLHGVLQVALESHWIIAVPAVAAISAAGALGGGDEVRAVHGVRERLCAELPAEIPASQEIILAAGADDGGLAFVVDEDHVVAFAPPAVGVLQHAERYAHQVAAAARLHVDV